MGPKKSEKKRYVILKFRDLENFLHILFLTPWKTQTLISIVGFTMARHVDAFIYAAITPKIPKKHITRISATPGHTLFFLFDTASSWAMQKVTLKRCNKRSGRCARLPSKRNWFGSQFQANNVFVGKSLFLHTPYSEGGGYIINVSPAVSPKKVLSSI